MAARALRGGGLTLALSAKSNVNLGKGAVNYGRPSHNSLKKCEYYTDGAYWSLLPCKITIAGYN